MSTRHRKPLRLLLVATTAVAALAAMGAATGSARTLASPVERSQATIEGTAIEGHVLSAGNGIWDNAPTSFSYQWVRCNSEGRACGALGGATARSYTIGSGDVGQTIVVNVTATNASGSTLSNSKPTSIVSSNKPPRSTSIAKVTGSLEVGEELVAQPGTFADGIPTSTTYRWQTCDAQAGNCADVTWAISSHFVVRKVDAGKRLRAIVTGTNAIGSASSTSDPTAVVQSVSTPPLDLISLPDGLKSIDIASVVLPNRLTLASVTFTPQNFTSRTSPVIARFRVLDTRGYAVRGAAVDVTAVPFGRVTTPGTVTTDVSGWAQVLLQPTVKLPLISGASVVLFVRAIKPGGSVLAGISTRRLFNINVRP